jgi:hypothetical protein
VSALHPSPSQLALTRLSSDITGCPSLSLSQVAGTLTNKMAPALRLVYDQMPEPSTSTANHSFLISLTRRVRAQQSMLASRSLSQSGSSAWAPVRTEEDTTTTFVSSPPFSLPHSLFLLRNLDGSRPHCVLPHHSLHSLTLSSEAAIALSPLTSTSLDVRRLRKRCSMVSHRCLRSTTAKEPELIVRRDSFRPQASCNCRGRSEGREHSCSGIESRRFSVHM